MGLAARRARPRHAGLALLALATAKVFLLDPASMDVAHRALVLAGLGLLGPREGPSGLAGGTDAAA